MANQLSLMAGGATVDKSVVQSLRLAKEVGDVADQFKKGDDVEVRIVARVTDVAFKDKYDAHGNVAETERRHVLRIDELEVVGVNQEAWKITGEPESEDDAKSNDELRRSREQKIEAAKPDDEPKGGDPEDRARADLGRERADLAGV